MNKLKQPEVLRAGIEGWCLPTIKVKERKWTETHWRCPGLSSMSRQLPRKSGGKAIAWGRLAEKVEIPETPEEQSSIFSPPKELVVALPK